MDSLFFIFFGVGVGFWLPFVYVSCMIVLDEVFLELRRRRVSQVTKG